MRLAKAVNSYVNDFLSYQLLISLKTPNPQKENPKSPKFAYFSSLFVLADTMAEISLLYLQFGNIFDN